MFANRHRPKLSDRQKAEIKEAWMFGATGLDLSVEYDVSIPAIHYHTKGLPRLVGPFKGRKRAFDYDRAILLRGQGLTGYVIGQRLGVSAVSIYRVVNYGENNGRVTKRIAA